MSIATIKTAITVALKSWMENEFIAFILWIFSTYSDYLSSLFRLCSQIVRIFFQVNVIFVLQSFRNFFHVWNLPRMILLNAHRKLFQVWHNQVRYYPNYFYLHSPAQPNPYPNRSDKQNVLRFCEKITFVVNFLRIKTCVCVYKKKNVISHALFIKKR